MTDLAIVDFRVRLPEALRPRVELPSALRDGYDAVLAMGETIGKSPETLDFELSAAGIGHSVVHAEYEHGDIADALNDAVAEFVAASPDRTGFGTVSLDAPTASHMASQVRRAASLGLRGINLQPSFFRRAIDDRELYAVYGQATERNLVVAVHTGVSYSRDHPIDGEQPVRLDRVACAFPELNLVALHGGWPWTAELAAVCRRHPQVYVDFGGLAPKYLGAVDTGWGPLFRLIDNQLSEQVLFATDWPAMDHERALREWAELPLKSRTRELLMGANAARLLGLDPSPEHDNS